jgi:hypothetical protein
MRAMTFLIIASSLLAALIGLAIVAYRANGTLGFLLLMLAAICYVAPRISYLGSGLFFQIRGWNTSGPFRGWLHSHGSVVLWTCDFLFVGLFIAALVLFIRQRRAVTPQA